MSLELEYNLVSGLLNKPSEIKILDIENDWIVFPDYRKIIEVIKETNGNEEDVFILAEKVKQFDPMTKITAEQLYEMSSNVVTTAHLPKYAKQLEYRFIKDKLAAASKWFSEKPTEENKNKLNYWMMQLDQTETEEDDGSLNNTVEEIYRSLEQESEPGILTYPSIDKVLGGGIQGGTLITIGARPGVGKTAFGINLAIEAMLKQPNIHIDFFTLEMSKKQMLNRFISRIGEINSYKLRDPFNQLDQKQKEEVIKSASFMLNSNFKIHDKQFNLSQIVRSIRANQYKAKKEPYIAFIDYLGLIDVSDKNQARYAQIGEITRAMKILTNELDIPIVLFTQLNRGIESRQNKEPVLSDIRESGSVEQDSNVVMFLSEIKEQNHNTDVIVAKNREGVQRKLRFNFIKSKMYFEEVN